MSDLYNAKVTTPRAVECLNQHGYVMTGPTFAKLIQAGKGPKHTRWGNRNLFDPQELIAWAEGRGKVVLPTAASTSDQQ